MDHFAWRSCIADFLTEESLIFVLFAAAQRIGTLRCFPQGESLLFVLFVAARRIWNIMPFSLGRKALFVYIAQLDVLFDFPPLDELELCAVSSKENFLLFVLFVAAQRIWNVVPFSSRRKDFVCL